tara:strand:- start:45 stop:701 length:657 start_codon:yes stop_codon:yes gene_type:complete
MKTVRLSRNLQDDIRRSAEAKYKNANPEKEYPQDGYSVMQRLGVIDKTERTKKMFADIWDRTLPMQNVDNIQLRSEAVEDDDDGDGNAYTRNLSYTLRCPPTDVPKFLCYYDELRLDVPCDDPTIVECMAIENYNSDLRQKKRNYVRQLEDVMYKFSTLNQLLKAAPYIKDLVPQDKLTKMYEKDDRSGRRAELAEVADSELQELREVLLEDALLGDD